MYVRSGKGIYPGSSSVFPHQDIIVIIILLKSRLDVLWYVKILGSKFIICQQNMDLRHANLSAKEIEWCVKHD